MNSDNEESKLPNALSQPSDEASQNLQDQNSSIADLEDKLVHLIQALETEDRPPKAVVETIVKLSAYRGAWPPAEVIREQEAALPGSGERLLRSTEKQSAHRQSLEKIQVLGNEKRMDRGQILGPLMGFGCLLAAVYVMVTLNNNIGLIGGLGLAAIGIATPSAVYIARGISHWLGARKED